MDFALSRGRRPSPIQIPKLERRREDDEDRPTPSAKSPSLLTTTGAARPTSQQGLEQSSIFWAGGASRLPPLSASVLSDSSPRGTTILQQPITTLQPSAATTTKRESPTRTTFMTVTKSMEEMGENEENEETPESTRTVFISAIPEIVTVTAPQVVPASTILPEPAAATLGPPKPQSQGAGALPPSAKIPVIALSVVAGLAMFFTVAVIMWRRKKRKAEARDASEQRAMAEADNGGFRVIPDTRPILP